MVVLLNFFRAPGRPTVVYRQGYMFPRVQIWFLVRAGWKSLVWTDLVVPEIVVVLGFTPNCDYLKTRILGQSQN